MRVADSMITELARSSVATARERAVDAQRVASSGLRVSKPSDDPTSAAVGSRKANEQARVEQMLKTANTQVFGLNVIDDAFAHMDELLAQAKQLAVQAANDTSSAQDRATIATQISSIRDSILAAANTEVDGKYVLGGMQQASPPFDPAGNFVGTRTVPQIQVAPGVNVTTSFSVGDVLAPASGLDVMAALTNLATACSTNNAAAIRGGIDDMSTATQQVTDARGAVGVAQSTLQMAISLGGRMRDRAAEAHSNAVDADAFDSISNLTNMQAALERAVAIAAKMPLPGLAQKA